jgi:hypothetical protein
LSEVREFLVPDRTLSRIRTAIIGELVLVRMLVATRLRIGR